MVEVKYTSPLPYLFSALLIGLFMQGCTSKHAVQVPTYIHIDSFHFVPNGVNTTSHDITCVWAYYNNTSIGVFDLPATIPVSANGMGALEVFPGIAMNGQNDRTVVYPFYKPDTFMFNAQPGQVITRTCVTFYYPKVKVYTISNFENGIKFYKDGGNIAMQPVTGTAAFEGSGSGGIYFNSLGDSSIDSTASFSIPTGAAFIEFNYKNSIPFTVLMQANLSNGASSAPYPLTGVYPSSQWKKFYLNLADFMAQAHGDSYSLYIKASSPYGGRDSVLLDNVQLLTY